MKKNDKMKKIMAPLWIEYPYIERYSIGWRMGGGEDYVYEFGMWFQELAEKEKEEYKELFPEPKGWTGWYENLDDAIYDENRYLLWNKDGKMKYSLKLLREKYKSGEKIEYLFFWGHQPSENGEITKSCLSQWWKSKFWIIASEYCCMEQYMMFEKARIFRDEETANRILNERNPKEIKALGRKVKNFDEKIWTQKKSSVILNGNYAKFTQNNDLLEFLISTEGKILVEASKYDNIWGIGMSIEEEGILNPFNWKGENLLGFALMEMRDEIIKVYKNKSKITNIDEDKERKGDYI